ncbi:MAG: hypothetical protein R3297_03125, partial [Desulfobulbales bacterium]|nr:hypothetical protein [Desulfobulbales bacterium]
MKVKFFVLLFTAAALVLGAAQNGFAGSPNLGCEGGCPTGLVCNEVDGTCVECLLDTDCDDVGCLRGICDEATNTCDAVPDDTWCEDGLFCSTDSCLDDGQCGTISTCPAYMDGCLEYGACDEVNDECVAIANDALCDDGKFCNGTETCDGTSGECLPGFFCPAAIFGCLVYVICYEENDTCPGVLDYD